MDLKKWIRYSLFSILLLSACSQHADEESLLTPVQPVSFSSVIDGEGVSRVAGAVWEDDAIGVFMYKAGEELSDQSVLQANKQYETSGTGLFTFASPSDAVFYPEDKSDVNFIAYYPYQPVLNGYIYPVNLSDQTSQSAIDLLYAKNETAYNIESSGTAPFVFSHQLSKLALNVLPSVSGQTLKGITAVAKGMSARASFNLADGTFTPMAQAEDIPLKVTSYQDGSAYVEGLLFPTESLEGVSIVFTLPSGTTFTWKFKSETAFVAGKRYIYQVTLKGESEQPVENYGYFESPAVASIDNTIFIQHFLPETDRNHIRNYSMLYDTKYKLAYWVAYPMHDYYIGSSGRNDVWAYDPQINEVWQPYLKNGFGVAGIDRGHQIASADRTYSVEGNKTTFYYSNMTAQNSDLNQGSWANLEGKVRTWRSACDTLYVVTGAMIQTQTDKEIDYIADNSGKMVAKPKYYYKALAQKRGDTYYTLGYKFSNESIPRNTPYDNYRVTVAELEEETGFNFFPSLSQEIKNTIDTNIWK